MVAEVILLLGCLGTGAYAATLQKKLAAAQAKMGEAAADLEKMQQSQAQVIHTTKLASLGQMIAGVAHEMNTPIGFVKSIA